MVNAGETAVSTNTAKIVAGSPLCAAAWMIGAIFSFSVMAVAGREAGQVIETAQLLAWRSIIGFPIVVALIVVSRSGFGQILTRRPGLHLARNISHFLGQYCWFYAVLIIPLAQLFALEFTAPIWVALMAPFLLGERFTRMNALGIGISFTGVLMVVGVWADGFASGFSSGQIWGFLAAFGFAGNMLATKRLTTTDTTLCILFYLALMQAPMGLLVAGSLPMIPPDAWVAFWVLALSLGGLGAHYCLAQAFRHADATIVTPMDFTRLPVIAIVGATFYMEPLLWNVLVGGTLIFLGNYFNMRQRR